MNKVWETNHKGITFDSREFTHALFSFKTYTYALCTRCTEIHTQKYTKFAQRQRQTQLLHTCLGMLSSLPSLRVAPRFFLFAGGFFFFGIANYLDVSKAEGRVFANTS